MAEAPFAARGRGSGYIDVGTAPGGLSDPNDLKKLLDNALSCGSVNSASSLIAQANWHGGDVVESIKDRTAIASPSGFA